MVYGNTLQSAANGYAEAPQATIDQQFGEIINNSFGSAAEQPTYLADMPSITGGEGVLRPLDQDSLQRAAYEADHSGERSVEACISLIEGSARAVQMARDGVRNNDAFVTFSVN